MSDIGWSVLIGGAVIAAYLLTDTRRRAKHAETHATFVEFGYPRLAAGCAFSWAFERVSFGVFFAGTAWRAIVMVLGG